MADAAAPPMIGMGPTAGIPATGLTGAEIWAFTQATAKVIVDVVPAVLAIDNLTGGSLLGGDDLPESPDYEPFATDPNAAMSEPSMKMRKIELVKNQGKTS